MSEPFKHGSCSSNRHICYRLFKKTPRATCSAKGRSQCSGQFLVRKAKTKEVGFLAHSKKTGSVEARAMGKTGVVRAARESAGGKDSNGTNREDDTKASKTSWKTMQKGQPIRAQYRRKQRGGGHKKGNFGSSGRQAQVGSSLSGARGTHSILREIKFYQKRPMHVRNQLHLGRKGKCDKTLFMYCSVREGAAGSIAGKNEKGGVWTIKSSAEAGTAQSAKAGC